MENNKILIFILIKFTKQIKEFILICTSYQKKNDSYFYIKFMYILNIFLIYGYR